MKKQTRTYRITLDSLAAYQDAAMRNARSLLDGASLLLSAGHLARAYFLAEAAIEENGKAAIVHFAKGRNIGSPGVQTRLRIEFESHTAKIRAAFFGHVSNFIKLEPEQFREQLVRVLQYAVALERGRVRSMYADFRNDGTVYAPADVVKPKVARDCVMLAMECARETARLVNGPPPSRFSSADDKWYESGPKGFKVWLESDFGEYLLDHMIKRGRAFSISEAVTTYYDAYLCKGRKFKPVAGSDEQAEAIGDDDQ